MDIKIPNKELFRIDEVAALMDWHPNTVYRYIDQGLLHEIPLPKGKHRRIPRAEVIRLLDVKGDR
jgi:excisionase family DNA binding protein